MFLSDYGYSIKLYMLNSYYQYECIKQFHHNEFTATNLLKYINKFPIENFYIVVKKYDDFIFQLDKTVEDDKVIEELNQIFEEAKQNVY